VKTSLSANQVIVGSALFLTAFANLAFFRNVLAAFDKLPGGQIHVLSVGAVLFCTLTLLLSLLCVARMLKPVLVVLFVLSASTAYFMDAYNVIIDADMLANVAATDPAEVRDVLTPRLGLYLLLLGILPAVVVLRLPVRHEGLRRALRARAILAVSALLGALALIFLSSGFYASFFREHKALRYYTNPTTPIYAAYKFISRRPPRDPGPPRAIAEDARRPEKDIDRELVIMVVGETARADRFSLNGYPRDTNPRLSKEDVFSFSRVKACGTSTATSVPCMFAIYDRDHFSGGAAAETENLLDVLVRAGVNVLWRDNNSDSKGVALRVPMEDYRSPQTNPLCDPECRDEGMLVGLQDYIDHHPTGDILIVLHQMGSHGPAYYKRYPAEFRVFTPTCETNQLDTCTQDEISNTYDNTILYTDHFLSRVIELLRANDQGFETAMLYVSDHGESLGESGLYLHGLPYLVAPDTQIRVPLVVWFGRNYNDVDRSAMRQLLERPLSHDNLFHTLLGFFETRTDVYEPKLDLLQLARDIAGTEREYQ